MANSSGKLTVHTSHGAKKPQTIGGVFVDGMFFVGRDIEQLVKRGVHWNAHYAIYDLKGNLLLGGLDSAKDAKAEAHVWFVREKFKK